MPELDNSPLTENVEARPVGKRWRVLWFFAHLAAMYGVVQFFTPWLAGWTYSVLPFLGLSASSSRFEFLFSHIFAFSFIPAFVLALFTGRWKHRAAEFVWIVPAVILAFKFFTFPATSVFQNRFPAAFHQFFESGFAVPEFSNWSDFWNFVATTPDTVRGMAQLQFTAPFYAGMGYCMAVWTERRTDIVSAIARKIKEWEESKFEDPR